MMTLPAVSSRYKVFCGSSGRQSAAEEAASMSAELEGRRGASPDAAGGGGTAVVGGAAVRTGPAAVAGAADRASPQSARAKLISSAGRSDPLMPVTLNPPP